MEQPLPTFRYHPNPLATGAIKPGDRVCECCGVARGFVYTAGVYATRDVEVVCPWCIADGSLAQKWEASLSDAGHSLARAGIAAEIIQEVTERTPGYVCWQSHDWMSCCRDACEFHGDAPQEEIRSLDEPGLARVSEASGFRVEDLREMVVGYEQGFSPAFYKFVCRHCARVMYNCDCD
ncbi:MAG: CbrC family protein [Armatimonadetes bacterium]|nr:CbrC family protein [Armatimonadota bacterium]